LTWASKLQTEIALSTAESEYLCLSEALQQTIYLMKLVIEMKSHGFNIDVSKPKVHCKLFEDNSGALEIAKAPKMRPRTHHINIKYHHFFKYDKQGLIEILPIDTTQQPADLFTKPLTLELFLQHRKFISNW
jgi:hypothetical protein